MLLGDADRELLYEALTRPILASCPAGYRPGPAREMLEVLAAVSRRWVAKRPSALLAA